MLDGLIDEFMLAGRAAGWSLATVRQYRWHLVQWSAWLAGRGIGSVEGVDRSALRLWAASIRDRWAPATCSVAVKAVRGFLGWCGSEGMEVVDSRGVLRTPPVPVRVQRTVTVEEVVRLLDVAGQPRERGVSAEVAVAVCARNQAIIALLFDSWLRASELCGLRVQDVDLAGRRLVVFGKGGDQRFVRFGDESTAYLREWLAQRPVLAGSGDAAAALFVSAGGSTPGSGLTPEGLRSVIEKLGERAGLAALSPHAFRRGGATAAIEAGAPTRWVQAHGRWAKLDMVIRYTQALDAGKQFDQFSPMRGLNGEP